MNIGKIETTTDQSTGNILLDQNQRDLEEYTKSTSTTKLIAGKYSDDEDDFNDEDDYYDEEEEDNPFDKEPDEDDLTDDDFPVADPEEDLFDDDDAPYN
ncbi:MAG: hypothetical protein R3321_03320 [Nitrososphaeraceae archaeon]|nr:hypothetical protein [Nitrososphaeraceae archaeon]